MQVLDVLEHSVLERSAHGDVVEDRYVLDVLAQSHAARVRADRHPKLRREKQDRQHLIDSTEAAGVELAEANRFGLEQLLEDDPVLAVLAGRDLDRRDRARDRRVA